PPRAAPRRLSRPPSEPPPTGHRPQEATIASSLPRVSDRSSGGSTASASGPNDRIHGTNPSPGDQGTRTSIHPSSRVRTVSALATPLVAHHATSGANAIVAVLSASPGPQGPARTCSAARKPSGGSVPLPLISRSSEIRDSRNDRISSRSRSRPTRYQWPPRTATPTAPPERSERSPREVR